jgi:hypothetical protein
MPANEKQFSTEYTFKRCEWKTGSSVQTQRGVTALQKTQAGLIDKYKLALNDILCSSKQTPRVAPTKIRDLKDSSVCITFHSNSASDEKGDGIYLPEWLIVVAHEEHHILPLCGLELPFVVRGTLSHGDFVILHRGKIVFIAERKSTSDFVSSIRSGHWSRQKKKLKELPLGSTQKCLIREIETNEQTTMDEQTLGMINTSEHKISLFDNISVVFTKGLLGTILYVFNRLRLLVQRDRESEKTRVTDELGPVKVPTAFKIQKSKIFPPGQFLSSVIGHCRSSSFNRGLGVLKAHTSLVDLIHHLDGCPAWADRVEYIKTLPYPASTKSKSVSVKTCDVSEGGAAKKRKTTIGHSVSCSVLTSLGYKEELSL